MRNRQVRRHLKRAGIRLQVTSDQCKQARLSAAVLAGDPHLLAAKQPKGGVGEKNTGSASYGDVGKVQHAGWKVRLVSLTGSTRPRCSGHRRSNESRYRR